MDTSVRASSGLPFPSSGSGPLMQGTHPAGISPAHLIVTICGITLLLLGWMAVYSWRSLALPFPARITLARPLLFPLLMCPLLFAFLCTPALPVLFHCLIDLSLVIWSLRGLVRSG